MHIDNILSGKYYFAIFILWLIMARPKIVVAAGITPFYIRT